MSYSANRIITGDALRVFEDAFEQAKMRGMWAEGAREFASDMVRHAPLEALRKWFDHDPDPYDAFATKYRQELRDNRQLLKELLDYIEKRKRLTLLTATKDLDHSHASIRLKFVKEQVK